MPPVSITAAPFETVEIDLWGTVYKSVPVTRSVQRKLDGLQSAVEDAKDPDAFVAALAKIFDARLQVPDGAKKPSVVIMEKWKADELSIAQLDYVLEGLKGAEDPS